MSSEKFNQEPGAESMDETVETGHFDGEVTQPYESERHESETKEGPTTAELVQELEAFEAATILSREQKFEVLSSKDQIRIFQQLIDRLNRILETIENPLDENLRTFTQERDMYTKRLQKLLSVPYAEKQATRSASRVPEKKKPGFFARLKGLFSRQKKTPVSFRSIPDQDVPRRPRVEVATEVGWGSWGERNKKARVEDKGVVGRTVFSGRVEDATQEENLANLAADEEAMKKDEATTDSSLGDMVDSTISTSDIDFDEGDTEGFENPQFFLAQLGTDGGLTQENLDRAIDFYTATNEETFAQTQLGKEFANLPDRGPADVSPKRPIVPKKNFTLPKEYLEETLSPRERFKREVNYASAVLVNKELATLSREGGFEAFTGKLLGYLKDHQTVGLRDRAQTGTLLRKILLKIADDFEAEAQTKNARSKRAEAIHELLKKTKERSKEV